MWTFFHVESRWNRVSNTRFVIIFQTQNTDSTFISLLTITKRPEHSHFPSHPNIYTPNPHSIGDKCIPSAVENSSAAENSHLLSSATSHSKPHSALSLSRTEVSSKTQSLSFYIYSQTFSSSPIFYHYSHLFIIKPHQSIGNFVFPSFPHNPKSFFPHFHVTPNQIHKTLRFYSGRNRVLQTRD